MGEPGKPGENFKARGDAIIRYYYEENPDALSDKEYTKRIAEWQFIQDLETAKRTAELEGVMNKVLYKLVNDIFKSLK